MKCGNATKQKKTVVVKWKINSKIENLQIKQGIKYMETLLTILLTLVYVSMVVSIVSLAIIFFVLACMAIKFFIEELID